MRDRCTQIPFSRGGIQTALILFLVVFVAGCGQTPKEESQNIDAILSPDDSRIAFVRSFHYYFTKASVFDPSGSDETVFGETSIYIIDTSTEELTKLIKLDADVLRCDRYYCPIKVSWEGELIAYSSQDGIYIMDLHGRSRGYVDLSRGKYGPPIPLTLSGDAQKVFYLGKHPWEYDREGLYSVELDGTGKTYIADLERVGHHEIYDMIWDSTQNYILIVERPYDSKEPVVWRITPDGTGLKPSENGLTEYYRRRLGGWESDPPFSGLEKLTRDISHAEWDVPAPDEFD